MTTMGETLDRRYASLVGGLHERRMVEFGLVRVARRELDHRFVELPAASEVAGQQPRIEGAAVRPGEQRTDQPAVAADLVLLQRGDIDAARHVAELADEVVPPVDAGPAEERIAGGLHQLLRGDGALTLLAVRLR